MRFFLDEDLPPTVATIGHGQRLDILSSHECGRNGLPDDEQLRLAAQEERCFVTRNARHFAPLTARFLEHEWPHSGLLLVPRSLPNHGFSAIARALLAYARTHESGVASYTVDFLVGVREDPQATSE